MTLMCPAVFTPHKEDADPHVEFPGLEYRMVDGSNLEDAVENTRYAAYSWFRMEFEREAYNFPSQSHYDDITLEQGFFMKYIMVTAKLIPDNDQDHIRFAHLWPDRTLFLGCRLKHRDI